jgi:putative transcriptional regulator
LGASDTLGAVVALRVDKLLKERGMTAHALAKVAGIPRTTAYRLARGRQIKRFDTRTIDRLCRALNCVPGDLFEYHR